MWTCRAKWMRWLIRSGQGAEGLIYYCRKDHFKKDRWVVFLHTSGSAALFAFKNLFADPAKRDKEWHDA